MTKSSLNFVIGALAVASSLILPVLAVAPGAREGPEGQAAPAALSDELASLQPASAIGSSERASPPVAGELHSFLAGRHPILHPVEPSTAGEPLAVWSDGSWRAEFRTGGIVLSQASAQGSQVTVRLAGAERLSPTVVDGSHGRYQWFGAGAAETSNGGWKAVAEVRYPAVRPGIDLVFSASGSGIKYDLELAAGADLDSMAFLFQGASDLSITGGGSLEIGAASLALTDEPPVATDGMGTQVECRFALRGATSVGFACPLWDRSRALTIDPLLDSTFVGGSSQDSVRAAVEDLSGGYYITGDTQSNDFPLANTSSFGGLVDVFVARINSTGALVYATFVGGADIDQGRSIALDADGNVLVAGVSSSANFPVTPGALDASLNGSSDGFLFKINGSTGQVVFSTYLGGSSGDAIRGIAVDPGGSIVVAGFTQSSDYPNTTGAYDPTFNGAADGFVSWLSADGANITASTFFGGSGGDDVHGIALDAAGNVLITGQTGSPDLPVSGGAYQPTISGTGDAFVAKLSSNGSALLFSTYLGGTTQLDNAISVASITNGDALIAGQTDSPSFPTTMGASDRSYNGGALDVFVARLDANGSNLLFSTFLGGSGRDEPGGIGVDAAGDIYVAGTTAAGDFPTTRAAFDESFNGPGGTYGDAFLCKLASNGSALLYSTFLGSSAVDFGYGLLVVANDTALVFGYTGAADFPTTSGAFDSTFNGINDGFFVLVDMRVFTASLQTNPPGFTLLIDGLPIVAPAAVPCAATSILNVSTNDPPASASQRYVFGAWSDGLPRTHNVTCTAGAVLVATFELQYETIIESSPQGFNVTMDGLSQAAPIAKWWPAGTLHNLSFVGPQYASADRRYVFSAWSDGGAAAHSRVADAPANLTVELQQEFRQIFSVGPAANVIEVDRVAQADASEQWWAAGSSHQIAAPTPQNVGLDSRYVFGGWTDGGPANRTVNASGPATFEANFLREFLVSVATDPPGLAFSLDGLNSTASVSEWLQNGTTHAVEVAQIQAGTGVRFLFDQWSDSGAASHPLVVRGAASLVASYFTEWHVTLTSEPLALSIVVDGSRVAAPAERWWANGSQHMVSASLNGTGSTQTRYALIGWGSSSQSEITVLAEGPLNLTAHYRTEYLVMLVSDRASGECDAADCWYAAGASANVSIDGLTPGSAGTRYRFSGWNGDINGSSPNQSLQVDGPVMATALWITQFELTADSEFGAVTGAGWYDARTLATLRVDQTNATSSNGTFQFEGWLGAASGNSPNATFVMTSPRHLVAQWSRVPEPQGSSPLPLILLLVAAGGAAAVIVAVVAKRRRAGGAPAISGPTSQSAPLVPATGGAQPQAAASDRMASTPGTSEEAGVGSPILCPRCSKPVAALAPRCDACGLPLTWE
jgi:hypothetical protein